MTSRMQTKLFNAIIRQCKRGQRLAHFSAYVRYRLEQYKRKVRKEIVSRKSDGCAPLFYACGTGNVKMVEYLISICGANDEQTGRWYCFAPVVTPGRRPRILNMETTPLRRACYKAKKDCFDIVRCLVEHGADINEADASGRTCLMEAVRNVKICELLLKNGADVDARDRKNKTALHYAIESHRPNTVKLLLDYGADVTLRSLDNYDALETACLLQSEPIFDYLVERGSYSPGRVADANELMGSRCLLDDTETALKYWRKAMEIRNSNAVDGSPLAKTASMPKRDCYRNASEFTTLDELEAIALDSDALKIQYLLIHERIFGEHHRATFGALVRIGATYTDAQGRPEFTTDIWRRCFDLWRRALEINAANDSISWGDVADVAQGLVRALYNLHERRPLEAADPNRVNKEQSRFVDVVAIFNLLSNRLVEAQPLSGELLVLFSEEGHSYEKILKCVIHLVDLLVKTARTSEAEVEVRALVRHLVNQNPMLPVFHSTLLHLCVSEANTIVSKYFPYDHNAHIFPALEVTKLLLECEADVNARNVAGMTPLYIASCPQNFSNQLVELLLDHGAHLDTPDKWGSTPAHKISAKPYNNVDLVNYTTLRCLAAQAIVKYEFQYYDLPASVNQFLDLHRL